MSDSESPITNGAGQHSGGPGSRMSATPDQSVNGGQSDGDLFGDDDDASIDQPPYGSPSKHTYEGERPC